MEGREHREPGDERLVKFVEASHFRKPFPNGGLVHQRLEARANVGEVVFEQMNASRLLSVRFGPVASSIGRAGQLYAPNLV